MMESLLIAGAVASAAVVGFATAAGLASVGEHRLRVLRSLGLGRARDALLSAGIRPLRPLCAKVMGWAPAARIAWDLSDALPASGDVRPDPCAVLTLLAAGAVSAGVLAGLLSGSAPCAVAVGVCAAASVAVWARSRRDHEAEAMREGIPEALQTLIACFRSGYSLRQALGQTAADCPPALGRLFDTAARRLEMGAGTKEALAALREPGAPEELGFVAVALDVQHQCGGSISAVLEAARGSVRSELELKRTMRVQTAQGRLSARIVTLMPFVLLALFSFVSPGFMEPFFRSPAGLALLAVALVMEAAGVLAVRRTLAVREV